MNYQKLYIATNIDAMHPTYSPDFTSNYHLLLSMSSCIFRKTFQPVRRCQKWLHAFTTSKDVRCFQQTLSQLFIHKLLEKRGNSMTSDGVYFENTINLPLP
ncbi:hypothetical protein CEXT_4731 [Caerostris extrusa]|uniref:Uncharacterized protein n=1 Tax=Caerostris extrusa TaxID=172846 RepID=A0AAV4PLV8_CAEEX|nr:hypothetical protein CEXT_4731 [Caerostris extrusa]